MSSGAASATATASGPMRGGALQETRSAAPRPWPRHGSGRRRGSPGRRPSAASKSPASRALARLRQLGVDLFGSSSARLTAELARGRRRAASRSSGAAARAVAGPGNSTSAGRRRARPRSAPPATPNICATRGAASTLTVARAHLPVVRGGQGARARRPAARCRRCAATTAARRPAPRLERTSTSASKLASVTSTPPRRRRRRRRRAARARCLRRTDRRRRPWPGATEGGDESRHQVCHVVRAPTRPASARRRPPAGRQQAAVRSAHMRKITLPSGTMLRQQRQQPGVDAVHLTRRSRPVDAADRRRR